MRWPFMLKRTHDTAMTATLAIVQTFVAQEYQRALTDGKRQVHAFMRDANAAVLTHARPEIAIRAVFQQAEREFRPEQLTAAERLYGPANLEEALDAAARTS